MTKKIDVIFDIETRNFFDDLTRTRPEHLDISVVCTYRSDTGERGVFWEKDLKKLEDLFIKADRIIGFNNWHFDEPVIQKYITHDLRTVRSIDILVAVRNALGTRIKLDNIAKATLGRGKIAAGSDAIKFWDSGQLDLLVEYCKQDVEITKDVFYKAETEGKLMYIDGQEKITPFSVDFTTAERIPESFFTAQHTLL